MNYTTQEVLKAVMGQASDTHPIPPKYAVIRKNCSRELRVMEELLAMKVIVISADFPTWYRVVSAHTHQLQEAEKLAAHRLSQRKTELLGKTSSNG